MPHPQPVEHPAHRPRQPRPLRWLASMLLATLLTACATAPTAIPTSTPFSQSTAQPPAPQIATTTRAPATLTRTPGGPTATPPPPPTATTTRTPTVPRPTAPTGQPTVAGVAIVPASFARVGLEDQALTTLAVGGKDGQTLFVGGKGVYRSTDGGDTWAPVRSEQEAPRVTTIHIVADNPQLVFVGVSESCTKVKKAPGFVSKDGGATWRAIGDNLLSIAADPQNTQRIYAFTCTGLQRSEDGGGTWEPLDKPKLVAGAPTTLTPGPKGSQLLYVASESEKGVVTVMRTNDGGQIWETLPLGKSLVGLVSLILDPLDARVILLSTKQGLYRSSDNGRTWTQLTDGLDATTSRTPPTTVPDNYRVTTAVVADPDHSGQYWVGTGAGKTKGVGIYRSLDNGATWRKAAIGLEGHMVQALAVGGVSNKRILFVATEDGLWSIAVN